MLNINIQSVPMLEQLIQFIQNHWMLCLAALLVLSAVIFEEIRSKMAGGAKLSAREVVFLLNRGNAVVIDLRNAATFASGHILGAINIVLADIEQHIKKIDSYKKQTIILVDEYGTNTQGFENKLRQHGFTDIKILAGGMNSWRSADLPLSKKL